MLLFAHSNSPRKLSASTSSVSAAKVHSPSRVVLKSNASHAILTLLHTHHTSNTPHITTHTFIAGWGDKNVMGIINTPSNG